MAEWKVAQAWLVVLALLGAMASVATAQADQSPWPADVKGFVPPAPGEHPRLLFRKSDLPELRKRAATPEGNLWVCPAANPALASAGTGDTLAGLIAGFLAQGLLPADAAILGLWVGARAADLASADLGTLPMLASDLPPRVAESIRELE